MEREIIQNILTGGSDSMKSITKKTIAAIFALLVCGFASAGYAADAKVIVKGSTTVLPISLKAAEEFKKEKGIAVSIDGSGSGNGIKALLDGNTDIANSSREMNRKELDDAKAKGKKIKEIAIAFDMVVPAIHPSNPVKNLTSDQLKGIYTGSITNWKEVGGKDSKIVVVSRESSSGTYEIWNEKVLHKADLRKDSLLQASSGAVVSAVAGNPKAIGYVGFGYLSKSIKTTSVNNIPVTIENGKSGKFPVSRKLYMYVDENKLSKEAKAFIDYILSAKGQGFVKEEGFIPLK
jgi:phosphate transport system substrate-binding protein